MKKYFYSILFAAFLLFSSVPISHAQTATFLADLGIGSSGPVVAQLQSWLISNGYSIPSISSGAASRGYFGMQTEQAVMAYQRAVGVPTTGFFGPLTRAKVNGAVSTSPTPISYPYPASNPYPYQTPTYPQYPTTYPTTNSSPIISGITTPTTLSVGQTGTWTVNASDPLRGVLSYSVDWGDNGTLVQGYAVSSSLSQFYQNTTFTHQYVSAGTYTITFEVRSSSGYTAQTTTTVQVVNGTTIGNPVGPSAGPLRVTSPNGGEIWQRGTIHAITWTSPYYFVASTMDIKLLPYQAPCTTQICPMYVLAPYTIATNLSSSQNLYTWTVGNVSGYSSTSVQGLTIPDGQYSIQICQSGTNNCDQSDSSFTIAD